jgi:sugar/nucleoside kinase (ribokinase family)
VRNGFAEYAMTPDRPLVLVAGAASRDLVLDDPRGWRLGGAATYAALTLARLGLRVRAAVGVDPEASEALELDHLLAAGVDLHLVPLESGPVFENIETSGGRRQRCVAVSAPFGVASLPARWTTGVDALFLGPVAGELDPSWASVPARTVALGWQGLLRDLRAGADVQRRPPEATDLVDAATVVGASRDDFERGTSPTSLAAFLGPSTLLALTDGVRGGHIVSTDPAGHASTPAHYPASPSDVTIDPTGAGDVFLAALLAAIIVPGLASRAGAPDATAVPLPGGDPTVSAAAQFAAAAASLVVEAPGLAGVPDLDAVLARLVRAPSRASRRASAVSSRGSGRPSQA